MHGWVPRYCELLVGWLVTAHGEQLDSCRSVQVDKANEWKAIDKHSLS